MEQGGGESREKFYLNVSSGYDRLCSFNADKDATIPPSHTSKNSFYPLFLYIRVIAQKLYGRRGVARGIRHTQHLD